ncbi:hypothetical protein [Flavobacterium ginsengiterrae]|uniref:Uncharacterized protein n=1 Tax=Flavobacterium ginsengiterrae TaxID=871695 RepID=A0ABP7GEJ3_9FLAO
MKNYPETLSTIEMAQLIRLRPAMYFGDDITLTGLSNFLFGFNLNVRIKSIPPFEHFNVWLRRKLEIEHSSSMHWLHIILEKCNKDERKAFDIFYELLDEFILVQPIQIIETNLLESNFNFYYSKGVPSRYIGEKIIIEPAPYHIKLIKFDLYVWAYFFDFNYVAGESKKPIFYSNYRDFKTIKKAKNDFNKLFGHLEWLQKEENQIISEFEGIIKNS